MYICLYSRLLCYSIFIWFFISKIFSPHKISCYFFWMSKLWNHLICLGYFCKIFESGVFYVGRVQFLMVINLGGVLYFFLNHFGNFYFYWKLSVSSKFSCIYRHEDDHVSWFQKISMYNYSWPWTMWRLRVLTLWAVENPYTSC